MASAAPLPRRTPAEWLAWEERQAERWELLGDEPRLMAGGSDNHNQIALNVATALRERLRGGACSVRASDVKVRLPDGRWAYPDVFVRCGPRTGRETLFDDPVVIVEVLSPGTSSYDLEAKRWAYQEIPSLRHLLLVAQDRVKVELASRAADGSWRSVFHTGLDQLLPLEAIGVELPLAAVYADVTFEAEEPARDALR
jgi:Uma2 family endonuclease